ncbi:leucine-rich repeat domain-containing protein [Zavarzinella formosa]|uniref:hypothetical protein n=1 Tax=Zavarzinella formosa TaxID=360055 RepID=UPI000304AD2D|nr:hypothetical protein [Zavarzinella formosa]
MKRVVARQALGLGLLSLVAVSSAQAPKDKPAPAKPKLSAVEITQIETKLRAANCALSYEDLPPLVPNGPRQKGQMDHLAFPADTKDADLAKLVPLAVKLPGLKVVDLGGCTLVTSKGYKELAKLSDLKAVYLDGATIDHEGLVELAKISGLRWLDLSRSTVTDTDLRDIGDFASLMTLKLEEVPGLTEKGLAHLGNVARLRALHVTIGADQAAMMAEIGKLAKLTELKVYPVSDAETGEIAKLTSLQELDVNDPYVSKYALRAAKKGMVRNPKVPGIVKGKVPVRRFVATTHEITSKGLENIVKCADLRVLKIAGHPLNLKESNISKLEFLMELDATGTDVNDDGAISLGKIKTLTKLRLSATNVTTTGVRELSLIGSLEELYVDSLPLTEEIIRYVSQNRKIKVLSLNNTRVDCTDRRSWASFNRLESVSLENTNVTDSTIMGLAAVKTLKFADVVMNCPNVTQDGAMNLQKEMPNGRVIWYSCDMTFWPGGGGDPSVLARRPDLTYRMPNQMPTKGTNTPPANTKAPPPVIRNMGGGGVGTKP